MTLGPLAAGRANPHTNAAPHLTPQQFHDMLLHSVPATTDTQTGPDTEGAPTQSRTGAEKETVLLDARNVYETRVGHFAKVRTPDARTLALLHAHSLAIHALGPVALYRIHLDHYACVLMYCSMHTA